MSTEKESYAVPVALRIVAWLFILAGLSSVIEMAVAAFHGHVTISTGPLNIFIGRGLLQLRPGWRMCALAVSWICLIVSPIFALLAVFAPKLPTLKVFGLLVGQVSREAFFILIVPGIAVLVWEVWVLSRADVRQLFIHEPSNFFASGG